MPGGGGVRDGRGPGRASVRGGRTAAVILVAWTAVVQVGASALVAASSAVTLVPAATGFTLPDRSSICGG